MMKKKGRKKQSHLQLDLEKTPTPYLPPPSTLRREPEKPHAHTSAHLQEPLV